nr:hypothetical protein [Lysinibacillus sphaericus]
MNYLSIYKTNINLINAELVERDAADNQAWDEFGRATKQESEKQTKVREYYFQSVETEVISLLLDIVKNIHSEDFEEIYKINMLKIATRYIQSEKAMTLRTPINAHPTPCDIFTSIEHTDDKITFFIAKIDIAKYFDRNEGVIKTGLPHSDQGNKTKNWKTATITIVLDDENNLDIEKVIITDTAQKIAEYWAQSFLEATEITDDIKNTKDVYKEILRIIKKNGGATKSPEVTADNTHYLNQFNGYMVNNRTFILEDALQHTFGEYEPLDINFPTANLQSQIITKFVEKRFDTSFQIIHNEIKNGLKVDYKISDAITLKVKHIDNIKNTIKSELNSNGEPIIIIKVDSVDNKVYQSFLTAGEILENTTT